MEDWALGVMMIATISLVVIGVRSCEPVVEYHPHTQHTAAR